MDSMKYQPLGTWIFYVFLLLTSCQRQLHPSYSERRTHDGSYNDSAHTLPSTPHPSNTSFHDGSGQPQHFQVPEIKSPWYSDEDSTLYLSRTFDQEPLHFRIQVNHFGGETNHAVLEREKSAWWTPGLNRIEQMSKTVLCYKGIPVNMEGRFAMPLQPLLLEFLDTAAVTLQQIDIWSARPYQEFGDKVSGYYEFDAERMGVIPYHKQPVPIEPDRYSMFTHVRAEGHHVIVNYELRGMKEMDVVRVEHTLHLYDLQGNLKQVIQLPSVDGAVISDDGKYMMYTYGGIGLANTHHPFATIEKQGWAIMNLTDKRIVQQEDIDAGTLSFNRLFMEGNFLRVAYSHPMEGENISDYHAFFHAHTGKLYTKQWKTDEWEILRNEWRQSGITDWMYYIKKYDFKSLTIER